MQAARTEAADAEERCACLFVPNVSERPRERMLMAKSSKKELQAKKRAKRREALKITFVHPWDGIDVSAWFDTSFLADGMTDESCGLLSEHGFYEDGAPAEVLQCWWAAVHQDEEKEVRAARLAASLHQSRKKAEQGNGAEAEAQYAAQKKAVLPELKRLADEGIVTANAVLGAWYQQGVNVGKNAGKAQKHLLFAAEKGDPHSCFLLASGGFCPDRTEELFQKSLEGGCPAAFVSLGAQCLEGRTLSDAEFEELISHLAAFAVKREFACLSVLAQLLPLPAAEEFRHPFAGTVLELVRRAASFGMTAAMELLGNALRDGVLCERDVKKAKELYKTAMQKGSAAGKFLYGHCLLAESRELPQPERNEKLQEGYAILREVCRNKKHQKKARMILGNYLVRSDDDKEFKEGIACLKKCLSLGEVNIPVWTASMIVLDQPSSRRRAQALDLLDAAALAGSAEAVCWRGVYTLMGMYGQESRKYGIGFLLTAGKQGVKEAWLELAGLYALGLYGFRANPKRALAMAIEGCRAGDNLCRLFRVLIELGEFSKAAKAAAGMVRDVKTTVHELDELLEMGDGFTGVVDDMLWLEATDVCGRTAPYFKNDAGRPDPAADFDDLAENGIAFAQNCVTAMRGGKVLFAAFCAHALKKISRTVYGRFYVGAMAVCLGMPQNAPASDVIGFLNEYLTMLPESFDFFRLRKEDSALEEKLAAWTEHMRAAVGK